MTIAALCDHAVLARDRCERPIKKLTKNQKAWRSPAWWSPSAVLQTPNFCGYMGTFGYHGNRVRLGSCLNDVITLPDPCNGRSRSSKVVEFDTNRKCICNFLLVLPNLPSFRDIAGFLLKTATPPLIHPNFGCSPWYCRCYRSEVCVL